MIMQVGGELATITDQVRRFSDYLTTLFQLHRSTVFKNRYCVFAYVIYMYKISYRDE